MAAQTVVSELTHLLKKLDPSKTVAFQPTAGIKRLKGALHPSQHTFDVRPESFAEAFAPLPIPAWLKAGAKVIDGYSGYSAVIEGFSNTRGVRAIYLTFEFQNGATPLTPDHEFLTRFFPPAHQLLPENSVVRLPNLSKLLAEDFAKAPLTPYICRRNVNVTLLDLLGLEYGLTLDVLGTTNGTKTVLGLSKNEAGEVVLLVEVQDKTASPHRVASASSLRHDSGHPHQSIEELRGGEALHIKSHRVRQPIRSLQANRAASDTEGQTEIFEADSVTEDDAHKVHLTVPYGSGDGEMMLVDVDPDRCKHYFKVKPGDLLTGGGVVLGLTVSWGFYQRGEDRSIFLVVTKVHEQRAYLLPQHVPYSVIGRVVVPREYYGPRIPESLQRPIPTGVGKRFEVPKLPQDHSAYNFSFPYYHRSSFRYRLFDTEYCLKTFGFKMGQRFRAISGLKLFSTFVGVAVDNDGVVEMMFQVDGVPGAGAYTKGTILESFDSFIELKPISGQAFLYAPQEERKDAPLQNETACYLGEQFPRLELIDADPDRCETYFGIRPGKRVNNQFTVVGMQKMKDKVHLFFRPDTRLGATTFQVPNNQTFTLFLDDSDADIQPIPAIKVTKLKVDPYKELPVHPSHPFTTTVYYRFGEEGTVIEPVDGNPEHCEFYFGIRPGRRLMGSCIFLGLHQVDGKVGIAACMDGRLSGQKFDSGMSILLESDPKLYPIPLKSFSAEERGVNPPIKYHSVKPDPKVPLSYEFPTIIGLDFSKSMVGLLDTNPEHVKRYFPGIKVGDRFGGKFTAAGLGSSDDEKVEMFFYVDGRAGAGTFTDGTMLIPDGEQRPVRPLTLDLPPPEGPFETFRIPRLQQSADLYNFNFQHVTRGNGKKLLLDTTFMFECHEEKVKTGTRFMLGNHAGFLTFVGVADEGNGPSLWFKIDKTHGVGTFTPGTTLQRSKSIVQIPEFRSRTMKYKGQKLTGKQSLRETTYVRTFDGEKTQRQLVDSSPKRCNQIFGLEPGSRIDDHYRVVGMINDKGVARLLFFEAEGRPCGGCGDNVDLEVEITSPQSRRPRPPNSPESGHFPNVAPQVFTLPANETARFTSEFSNPHRPQILKTNATQARNFVSDVERLIPVPPKTKERLETVISRFASDASHPLNLKSVLDFVATQPPLYLRADPLLMLADRPAVEEMTNDLVFQEMENQTDEQVLAHQRNMFEKYGEGQLNPPALMRSGLLNLLNEPRPPEGGDHYTGDMSLVLADSVRPLCTVNMRRMVDSRASIERIQPAGLLSVGSDSTVHGSESLLNPLSKMDHQMLKRLLRMATGQRPFARRSHSDSFLEFHVHAPLFLSTHVTHIVLKDNYRDRPSDLALVLNFARKNSCFLILNSLVRKLAPLRLASKDHLERVALDHGINNLVSVTVPVCFAAKQGRPVYGHHDPTLRDLFDKLIVGLCMRQMEELSAIVSHSAVNTWARHAPIPYTIGVYDPTSGIDYSDSDDEDDSFFTFTGEKEAEGFKAAAAAANQSKVEELDDDVEEIDFTTVAQREASRQTDASEVTRSETQEQEEEDSGDEEGGPDGAALRAALQAAMEGGQGDCKAQ